MNLASLLTEELIVPEMTATERWPAIVELVDHLEASAQIDSTSKESILEALRLREEQTSTGIGAGVAIPHAFSEKLEKVVVVFGRSTGGIEFEAIDQAPVHWVVLFIVPKDEYHMHLRTLAAIAKMLNSSEIRNQLAKAESREEILEVLSARPSN